VSRQFLAAIAGNPRNLLGVLGISGVVGAAVGLAVTGGTTRGLMQGALSGVLIALLVRVVTVAGSTFGVNRLPFGTYVAISALATAGAICGGLAAASVPWLVTEGPGSWRTYVVPFVTAVAVSVGFTWWFALDRLLGGGVLVGLLTGRGARSESSCSATSSARRASPSVWASFAITRSSTEYSSTPPGPWRSTTGSSTSTSATRWS
jgi:hypothetical protein